MQPGKTVGNDVSGRAKQGQREAASAIEKGRREVSEDAGTLSEDYGATVRAGKINPKHGGNQAVWDTVGANAGTPEIGRPSKREPLGDRQIGKDGVPVAGPTPAEPSTQNKDPSGNGKRIPGSDSKD